MSPIQKGRYTSTANAPFVLFIIGMRINSFWRMRNWLAVFFAMGGMIKDLTVNKKKGLLHWQIFFYWRGVGLIQYWKSYRALSTYANTPNERHAKARKKYYAKNDKGVGIWHETYLVDSHTFESIYVNMPQWGLGKAFGIKTVNKSSTAKLRLNRY